MARDDEHEHERMRYELEEGATAIVVWLWDENDDNPGWDICSGEIVDDQIRVGSTLLDTSCDPPSIELKEAVIRATEFGRREGLPVYRDRQVDSGPGTATCIYRPRP
jgi:hypothetical protein